MFTRRSISQTTRGTWVVGWLLLTTAIVRGDGPQDNRPEAVRPIPPLGVVVPPEVQTKLEAGLRELKQAIDAAKQANAAKPFLLDLIPDVEIYHKAVRFALEGQEFYISQKPKRDDLADAQDLLQQGLKRAAELRAGQPSWIHATGLVVRGYRSRIDDSVQPYGLVIPESYKNSGRSHRCDFWWHGRAEQLTELDFIRQRQKTPGEFTPADTIVVHPYGRYCNANKFAGEIDTLEVLAHVQKYYRIDPQRIVARGFSMGGAACWQFAVHYPSLWCAAAPGAGFAETPEFLQIFQKETVEPTWYERRLWKLYNATDHALNLTGLPTVAYSGELDRQKQAADVMARELRKIGCELTHIIGPKTEHRYEPNAKAQLNTKIDQLAALGKPIVPHQIRFETHTLRYSKQAWVEILALEKHWRKARVVANLLPNGLITIEAENVKALKLNFETGHFPSTNYSINAKPAQLVERFLDEEKPLLQSDRSFQVILGTVPEGLSKSPGLQGPIDDAFMDRFIHVKPTGQPLHPALGRWTEAEMNRAILQWKKHFRGEPIVKTDRDITEEDIAQANLILWGDPQSHQILGKIAAKLPLREFSETCTTCLIYPNPLNPKKYVVLNSGFTFREYDYLNNARQVPKLPDYAILDITTPPGPRAAGRVVRAGFFDEAWQLQEQDGK